MTAQRYVQPIFRLNTNTNIVPYPYNEHQFFVCGSGKVSTGVKETILSLIKVRTQTDDAAASAIFDKVMKGRYATDIFE